MHVDDFIDKPFINNEENRNVRYAQWFLNWKRMPAYMQRKWAEFYGDEKLFCQYKGKKYRCTGASRMGDVWLTSYFNQDQGYELRVDVEDCSEWSAT